MANDRSQISEIFGNRLTKKLKGTLHTTLEQLEHGHHAFRAYWKHPFLKQYEKFSTFLRNEICSNNLTDFGSVKALSICTPCARSSSISPIVSLPSRRSA